jgi:membrane protease YdiL (CAAX protease family)
MLKGFSNKPRGGGWKLRKKSEPNLQAPRNNLHLVRNGRGKVFAPGFGRPWTVIGTTVLIFLISQVVAAVIIEVLLALFRGGYSPSGSLEQSTPVQFFYILLAEGGAAGLVFWVLKRRNIKLAQIGLGRRPQASDIIKGLLGFAAFFIILALVNGLMAWFLPDLNGQNQDIGFNNLHSDLDQVLALIALVIFPPIGEEILVRGYLYSGLKSSMRFLPAMLITSLIFGLAHLQLGSGTAVLWAAGIDTFVLSVVLVYLRQNTGALYAGMLIHALNNLIAFGVHFH